MKTKTIRTIKSKYGTEYRLREISKNNIVLEHMVPRVTQLTKTWFTMGQFASIKDAENYLKTMESIVTKGASNAK